MSIGQILVMVFELLAVLALFHRFGNIKGWKVEEILLFYGVTHLSFSLAEVFGRGYELFASVIKSGDFDRYLLRPLHTAYQIAGRDFDVRVGRVTQALCVLLWAIVSLKIYQQPTLILLIIGMLVGGFCIFYGLFVLQATMCFWTTESIEIFHTFTYGGAETAQYPLSIYRIWFRRFFTYVVPFACINYIPAQLIFPKAQLSPIETLLALLAPSLGILFLIVCLCCWGFGVRRYCSTGS